METFVPSSTNIDRVDYDEPTKEMTVTFKQGQSYLYRGVPRETFFGIQHAPSAGGYFYKWVRDKYPYEEV